MRFADKGGSARGRTSKSISGERGAKVTPGVDRGAVEADFVVHVRPGGAAADSGVADDLSALDAHAGNDREGGKVPVSRGDAEAVVHNHQSSVARARFRGRHDSVSRSVNGLAVLGGNIHAGMERAFTRERVEALAEGSGQ